MGECEAVSHGTEQGSTAGRAGAPPSHPGAGEGREAPAHCAAGQSGQRHSQFPCLSRWPSGQGAGSAALAAAERGAAPPKGSGTELADSRAPLRAFAALRRSRWENGMPEQGTGVCRVSVLLSVSFRAILGPFIPFGRVLLFGRAWPFFRAALTGGELRLYTSVHIRKPSEPLGPRIFWGF